MQPVPHFQHGRQDLISAKEQTWLTKQTSTKTTCRENTSWTRIALIAISVARPRRPISPATKTAAIPTCTSNPPHPSTKLSARRRRKDAPWKPSATTATRPDEMPHPAAWTDSFSHAHLCHNHHAERRGLSRAHSRVDRRERLCPCRGHRVVPGHRTSLCDSHG